MSNDTTQAPPADKPVAKHEGKATTGGQLTRLVPQNFGDLERIAGILGKSDIVPKDMVGKPANILLALMFGNEIGLTPAQALQNIMVVNGRPSLWGDATMGLVIASDVYEDSKDSYDERTMTATFAIKRRGKDWLVRTFSKADAERAKLWTKEGPWQQYPQRMLFHRARSWALRDAFPDVLKGIRYYEEEKDIIETTAERGGKVYDVPKEKAPGAPDTAPAASSAPATPTPPVEAAAPKTDATETTFRCGGGATSTEFVDNGFVIRDDQDPPVKYYHDNPEWHSMAKAAKEAKAFLTGTWVDKAAKKGVARWLTALSLRS